MRILWSLALLPLTVAVAQVQEWTCQTSECEGHKAGYDGAMTHEATDQDCNTAGMRTDSPSFAEGCKSGLQAKREQHLAAMIVELRPTMTPLIQQYLLGKQAARELRALPSDCEEGYKNAMEAKADESAATFFKTGCLEVARKQAKKIIKENERQANEAEKQSKRQTQEEARSAPKTP